MLSIEIINVGAMKERNTILVIILLFVILTCDSCFAQQIDSKSAIREKILDEYLSSKFTVSELLELKFSETEIKEKDVYNDLYNYYMFWAEQKRHFKRNPQPYLIKADSMMEMMNSSNENLLFYKIAMLQTKYDTIEDPYVYEEIPLQIILDTLHYGIFYFNSYDSLVKVIYYK